MKQIVLILALVFSIAAQAQNENNSVRIDYTGTFNGYYVVKITNKQSCTSNIGVYFNSPVTYRIKAVNGNSSDTVLLALSANEKVHAVMLSKCGNNDPDLTDIFVNISLVSILPIKFTSFTATGNQVVTLNWNTEEDQVEYFNVQKSIDGAHWSIAGKVQAGKSTYKFTDNSPASYYRIQSVEKSGTITYSSVIKLTLTSNQEIAAFPNPTVSSCQIRLKTASNSILTLVNMYGVIVKSIPVTNSSLVTVDMSTLQAGIYYASIDGISLKLVKQ